MDNGRLPSDGHFAKSRCWRRVISFRSCDEFVDKHCSADNDKRHIEHEILTMQLLERDLVKMEYSGLQSASKFPAYTLNVTEYVRGKYTVRKIIFHTPFLH